MPAARCAGPAADVDMTGAGGGIMGGGTPLPMLLSPAGGGTAATLTTAGATVMAAPVTCRRARTLTASSLVRACEAGDEGGPRAVVPAGSAPELLIREVTALVLPAAVASAVLAAVAAVVLVAVMSYETATCRGATATSR